MNSDERQDNDVGDHADLAGTGQERRAPKNEGAFDGAVEREPRPHDEGQAHGPEIVRSPRSEELISAADILVSASEEDLRDAGLGSIFEAAYSYQWSGMLPSPDEYNKYDEPTRERICRWNDAFTLDESARQDRLVDNEIKQQETSVAMTFVLVVGFGIAAFVAFMVTRDIASFGFLSVPLLNFLSGLIKPVLSKSSRDAKTTEHATHAKK